MNDEQHRVALFQQQPEGTGPFFRLAALSLAQVVVLHYARSTLPAKIMASGSLIQVVLAGPNMALSNKQIRYLRGLTHRLQPVVMVGDKGLSENIMSEIEAALQHHELIKIRIRAEREQRRDWMQEIADKCAAEPVHAIGQVACYYRRNGDKPVLTLPGS